jgi:DNA-binding CsgD family transcriptional regulator
MKRARDVLLEAFFAYAVSGEFTLGITPSDIAAVAQQTRPTASPLTVLDHLLDGSTAFFGGNRSRAYEHFRRAGDLLRAGKVTDDEIASFYFGWVTTEMFDDSTFNAWLVRTEAYARQRGALYLLTMSLVTQIKADVRAGRLRAAAGHHAEALEVALAIGLPAAHFRHVDVHVRAWAGEAEGTRTALAAQIEISTAFGSDTVVLDSHWALAILYIGAARYEEALAETDFLCARNVIGYPTEALPLAVEAAVRSGQTDKAERALAQLESRAVASGTPWALGLLARSKALLAGPPEAAALFEEAIGLLEQTSVATDLAHARLLYGEWLRREKRKVEARAQLRIAHDFFSAMGAPGFARRAAAELLATGEHVRKRPVERDAGLTSQEHQIAELAADGLTNSEIASRLFISPATVDYHLRKVFVKLDVSSRLRLAKVLRSDPDAYGT